jgi:adenylylsulfate kinase
LNEIEGFELMKILVMGLPGSGKTYLSERLVPLLNAAWYNADVVRKMANDWDFSVDGRDRQSKRMRTFADFEKNHGRFVVCDFVCPSKETRKNFDADIVVWMNTIKKGRFEDTNKLFENPEKVDFRIIEWNDHNHEDIAKEILKNV